MEVEIDYGDTILSADVEVDGGYYISNLRMSVFVPIKGVVREMTVEIPYELEAPLKDAIIRQYEKDHSDWTPWRADGYES